MDKQTNTIQEYLQMDISQIQNIIAKSYIDYSISQAESSLAEKGIYTSIVKPPSSAFDQIFHEWFNSIYERLQRKLCIEWDLCKKIDDKIYEDEIALITGIADIVVDIVVGVPPITVSVLLVKIGLKKFCSCKS
jgi:hypothetical protein